MPNFACLLSILLMGSTACLAGSKEVYEVQDFGNFGHVFEIKEVSLMVEIMGKLEEAEKNGKLKQLNDEFVAKVRAKVSRPVAVAGISLAKEKRSWTYDPTYVQTEDIKDDKGRIVVAAGTTINALTKISWGRPLIFIDGDDQKQVDWALSKKGIITLTNGSPIELSERINERVYFDQGGHYCRRFKIERTPAIVEQDGLVLRITEEAI